VLVEPKGGSMSSERGSKKVKKVTRKRERGTACKNLLTEEESKPENRLEARMRIPVFLINLDRSPDRLRYMQAQAEKCGMVFERVAAVDGFNPPHELADYFAHYRTGEEPLLAPGDFGCYASHIKVWQTILRSGSPVALVLEDDAAFDDDVVKAIEEALAALPTGWDMVHLSRRPDRAVKSLAVLPCGRTLVRYSRIPSGTAGYLVSGAGAAKMLNPSIARVWPVDTDTRRPWVFDIDAYGLVAPPLRQKGIASTITAMGGKRRYRAGLPLPSRYCWTGQILRGFRSAKFNVRKLGLGWWLACLGINCAMKVRAALRPVSRAAGLVPLRKRAVAMNKRPKRAEERPMEAAE
jgi:glycosyl transferase, family 25